MLCIACGSVFNIHLVGFQQKINKKSIIVVE